MREMIIVLGLLFVSTTGYILHLEDQTLKSVQQGTVDLICITDKGEIEIDPNKVAGYHNETWFFTNGQATNCELEKP